MTYAMGKPPGYEMIGDDKEEGTEVPRNAVTDDDEFPEAAVLDTVSRKAQVETKIRVPLQTEPALSAVDCRVDRNAPAGVGSTRNGTGALVTKDKRLP